ncbi:MAG: AAA family ATPase [Labilithrix sp.]|nr:AAA family ATPase [Labilithrix sp.]MBX3214322.1 AAA family ATPase [Labilithrix sp.]
MRRRVEQPAPAEPSVSEPSRYVDLFKALEQVGRERDWLVEGAIEGTPIVVFSGPEKRGKSWVNIDLTVSIASATAWLGCFRVPKPGTVVVVDGEYGAREWARRANRICAARGLDSADVFPSIRYFDGQWGFLLDPMNGDYCRLLHDVRENPPSLIVIDPLRNFLDGDENSAKDVLLAMRMLVGLRTAAECPVLAVHHLNKGGGVSGSRALKTRADVLVDGTDQEVPVYSARGRSIRSGDAIANRFSVRIEHEDDHDDTIAKTRLALEWFKGREHAEAKDSAEKVLVALKAAGAEGLSINGIHEATNLKVQTVKRLVANHLKEDRVRRKDKIIRGKLRDVYVHEPDWPEQGEDA